jgi:hypothetical protein
MTTHDCPDPETLAVFALGAASGEEWRRVVRHLADCAVCRRQVAIASEDGDAELPAGEPVRVGAFAARTKTWQRVAQGIAAAALLAAGVAWALLQRPRTPAPPSEVHAPVPAPRPAPEKAPAPAPRTPDAAVALPEKPPPAPPEQFVPRPTPAPSVPAPDVAKAPPAPSPFLAERATSEVAQAIEISAGEGTVSRRSGEVVTPLQPRTMILPSDTLLSPVGGSVVLPDGATVHLAREAELRLSWSQTLACATVDVRKGDAVVDLGKTPRPLHVTRGPVGVHLRESAGRLWVSAGEQSLRATPLSGATQFRTRAGEPRRLEALQSLVLGEAGDAVETVAKADVSAFSTLEPKARAASPAPADKRPPLLDNLLTALGQQSYAYRVTGRQVRDGVWSPTGFFTSAVEEFTAARRSDDKEGAHVRRGGRAWDDLGKVAPGSREARLVEIVRSAPAPHLMVLELLGSVRGESAPRTEQVRDRVCAVWDLALDPRSLRPFMEKILESAVAEGRMERPDAVYWDTLEGSLEAAALKFDAKVLRVVDRRKVSYSYKTPSGLDRRTYHLETVYEFFSHGAAAVTLPPEMLKELSSPK